ncbi:MAG TPA: hypothetical protein VD816_12600 [Ohtaekwangia sp.]|nr:hypothetical protein [Ohtaekwangia sp.]
MELLDANDFKNQLLRKSETHRAGLEEEVKSITARTEKIVTNALIIGGALAVTYFLLHQFAGPNEKPKSKTKKIKLVAEPSAEEDETTETVASVASAPGIVTQIGTALASQASVFLLNLAKEKLSEYLGTQTEKKAE